MKAKIFTLIIVIMASAGIVHASIFNEQSSTANKTIVVPVGDNLLKNSSFEEYSINTLFGTPVPEFNEWSVTGLFSTMVEENDKLDGDVSLHINPTIAGFLDQSVLLTDESYTAGTNFQLKVNFKVLNLPDEGYVSLDCCWEPAAGGDSEAMKAHEVDSLQRIIATNANSDWQSVTVITSKPEHSAIFHVRIKMSRNASVLFDDFSLVEIESQNPQIDVTPTNLPDFDTIVGQQVRQSIRIKSQNCTDFVYLKVEHKQGAAFTIDKVMVAMNFESDVEINFSPKEAGEFQSILTIYSQINEFNPIVITLNGKAEERSPHNIDWQINFNFAESTPLTYLNENFDNISHNETLVLDGWQNVAALDQRPWWGFDEAKTIPGRGNGKYAKATAYQYGKDSSAMWESWLVTPALDYKNAKNKVFSFSVMGEYLPTEKNEAKLEVYYIDHNKVDFQNITELFDIPIVADDGMKWRTFYLDLTPYSEMKADIFHIGFHFEGPNGEAGYVVYYIDSVSWGVAEKPASVYYILSAQTDNQEMGRVTGGGVYKENTPVSLHAIPNNGYHFVQWNDGIQNNPRTVELTQNTTFTAYFAIDTTGTCGKDYALRWAYNPSSKTLTISGNGSFDEHMECGIEAKQNMINLVINEGVTAIGANAFSGCANLATVQLPASLKTIGERAFYNCLDLTAIYNYRPNPCLIETNTFEKVNTFDCTLYVLADSENKYSSEASGWKIFYEIKTIGASETTTTGNEVTVNPNDNTVTLTWPTNDNAETYTIEITKDGVVFCTLIFNANGQLTGIAFAPSRKGEAQAPAAAMTASGMQFTVTGLNSGTKYAYSLTAKDAADQDIVSYTGDFTTTGVATSIDSPSLQGRSGEASKLLRDGQLLILHGNKIYTATGLEVK